MKNQPTTEIRINDDATLTYNDTTWHDPSDSLLDHQQRVGQRVAVFESESNPGKLVVYSCATGDWLCFAEPKS